MAELVAHGHLAGTVGGGHADRYQTDVGNVFHGALGGVDIADAIPTVGAEPLFEGGHDIFKNVKSMIDGGAVVFDEADEGWISAINALVVTLYRMPIG
jgi:hypothetical protein